MPGDPNLPETVRTSPGAAAPGQPPTSRLSHQMQAALQSRRSAGGPSARLQAIMDDQRQRWMGEQRPRVEDYLDGHPGIRDDADAVLYLIYNEVLIREHLGESPALEEYLTRFPALASGIRNQFEVHEQFPFDDLVADTRPAEGGPPPAAANDLEAGRCLGDFEIIRLLGSGSFARVYLARQISLDRPVALKVSANRGSEARTLASLEHAHIVQVFSETVDLEANQRLLCMQYVPGTTLADVIDHLERIPGGQWTGRDVLEAIDEKSDALVTLDPASFRDRELLGHCDGIEAVCWLGARLAEALAYAHRQGVLHRDIKPANILMNRYGRPFLADFNLALDPHRLFGAAGAIFGGTLEYMPPEHIDAFNPKEKVQADVVDQRSDIYSLGVVLFELLTGHRPFPQPPDGMSLETGLRLLAAERRLPPPLPSRFRRDVPAVLDAVLARCLQPDPALRYQEAADLANALEGAREHCRIEKDLPPLNRLGEMTVRRPFLMLLLLGFLPHVFGSIVNISYNSIRIVRNLSDAQQATFFNVLLPGYNLVVYGIAGFILYRMLRAVAPQWVRLVNRQLLRGDEVDDMRRRVLRWPAVVVGLACLGWLPGGLLFPLLLHALADPVPPDVFGHFVISFALSGLIALTYSFFAVEFVVLRAMYPRLWLDAHNIRARATEELRPVEGWLRVFQFLAGSIPLIGAGLIVLVGPDQFSADRYWEFRLLVTGLIGLGTVGFGIALWASAELGHTLQALTNLTGRERTP